MIKDEWIVAIHFNNKGSDEELVWVREINGIHYWIEKVNQNEFWVESQCGKLEHAVFESLDSAKQFVAKNYEVLQ